MSTLKTNNIQHVDRSDPSIIINTDGSVNIAGTMTYEDVTNVDAVGIITGRDNIDAQKQVHVGTGVSVKAGGLNVTAGITTVQALQATTGTFSAAVSGTTGTFSGAISGTTGTFTSHVSLGDSDKLRFGDGNDLQFYHSTFNYIESHNDAEIHINANTGGSVENMAKFKPNGAVELYHNGSKKIETTSTGISVTGNLVASNHLLLGDSQIVRLGASQDFEIQHNGSQNYINSSNGNIELRHTVGGANEAMLKAIPNGAVELYHNSIKTLDTTTTGIRIHGDEGSTAQLQLLADQGDDDGDYWRFVAETNGILNIQDYGAGSWYNNIRLTGNTGGVDLFHNNTIRLSTSSAGISIQNGHLVMNRQDTGNEGGEIVFNRASDNSGQWVNDVYGNDSSARIRWHSGGVEKLNLLTSGNVEIPNGNLVIGTAGKGIDFSAQTPSSATGASTSAEILDHYEEGTWTPVPTLTYNPNGRSITLGGNNAGVYTKVGRIVHLEFVAHWTAISGSGSYNVGVNGLPFAADATTINNGGSGRSNMTGYLFGLESIQNSQVNVLRRYDNGSPNTNDIIHCFAVYTASS